MKKLILGIGMFIGGILGVIGVMLTAVLNGEGLGSEGLTECIAWSGMMPYFIIFALLAIAGLYIAYKEAYDKN